MTPADTLPKPVSTGRSTKHSLTHREASGISDKNSEWRKVGAILPRRVLKAFNPMVLIVRTEERGAPGKMAGPIQIILTPPSPASKPRVPLFAFVARSA